MPVIGTYVDPRILTGFKYRVRAADSKKFLFNGDALVLQAIGRGYGKRLTFASNNLNNNGNYFWSDTNPEGYGFSIEAVSPGDKFRYRFLKVYSNYSIFSLLFPLFLYPYLSVTSSSCLFTIY